MALAFSRILLAYDDTAESRMALRYACALARSGATLAVAHAVGESNFIASAAAAGGFPAIDPTRMIAAVDEAGDSVLKAAVRACAAHGIVADKVFVHGTPVDRIVAAGLNEKADLVVVGTHGRKGVARAVLGSVAESILRASDVPVLVITRHVKAPRRKPVFGRALVAVDDSGPSKAALSIAARLAAGLGTRLTLCNVIDSCDDSTTEELDSFALAGATALLKRAEATSGIAQFLDDEVVVKGDRAEAIEHTALQRNCDVIVMGSHARRGFHRLLGGSIAEGVARGSALPVLVVPMQHGVSRIETYANRPYETA